MKLASLGTGAGYVKAGFLGFAGSGKTFTAKELAIGTRAHFKLDGPIAMLDTEGGAQYIAPDVRKRTGKDLVGVQTRALADAVDFTRSCEADGVSVAIIDSVTHLWREVCESYLKQVNEARAKNNRPPRTRLEFQDWGPIKDKWAVFSNLYLNSKLHLIICGRAGFEWDYQDVNEEGKKELVKTGVKMKTEGEFGYEPSVLAQMEQIQDLGDGKTVKSVKRRITVIKDRFGVIDGKQADNPTFDFFAPHIALLTPGAHVSVDTTRTTPMGVDESGDADWQRERRQRAIYAEEIQGLLTARFPTQSALDKQAKATTLHAVFKTYSWTAVENLDSAKLKTGLEALPQAIEEHLTGQRLAEEMADQIEKSGKRGKSELAKAGKE